MTEIKGLTINETDENGRTTYEPVVATVVRFSDFNAEHFALSGIDGFWSLAPRLKDKIGVPPKGTKARWTMATKPKTDPRAKPGSVYMDVIAADKVPDDYKEPERAAPADAPWGRAEAAGTPQTAGSAPARPAKQPWDTDSSIISQSAFIRLTELIVTGKLPMYAPDGVLTSWGADWVIFYTAFKRGEHPAWPEPDPTVSDLPAGDGWGFEGVEKAMDMVSLEKEGRK